MVALWQAKTRTLLTLTGVALGATMLIISLALSRGMRAVVDTEFGKDARLRTVTVYQSSAAAAVDEADIPPARLAVPGDVSPGRRERLRQMLIQRYRDELPRRPIKLTPDRLAAIAELEHVAAVVPAVNDRAAVTVNGSPRVASLALLAPDHHSIADRIVYGRLPDPVRPELLISESVLFYCGVVADSDVEKFVGQSLRLEVRREPRQAPYQVLNLLGVAWPGQPSPAEMQVLGQVADRLPDLIARLDLPAGQAAVLKSLLDRAKPSKPDNKPKLVAAEFTVAGVYHHAADGAVNPWGYYGSPEPDLILAAQPAQDLLARLPNYADHGFERATILVDHEENVHGVVTAVEQMGLGTYSLVEWAERATREVTLIGLGMTVLSVLALVVAGLGITNTMVTSVLERTHDIGIMKAVGARNRQVVGLFLIEGVVLGLLGGGLGLLGAWLFSLPAEGWVHGVMEQQAQHKLDYAIFRFPPAVVAGAPLFAMLVTTAAALLPARRAARIDPAVTLRTE